MASGETAHPTGRVGPDTLNFPIVMLCASAAIIASQPAGIQDKLLTLSRKLLFLTRLFAKGARLSKPCA